MTSPWCGTGSYDGHGLPVRPVPSHEESHGHGTGHQRPEHDRFSQPLVASTLMPQQEQQEHARQIGRLEGENELLKARVTSLEANLSRVRNERDEARRQLACLGQTVSSPHYRSPTAARAVPSPSPIQRSISSVFGSVPETDASSPSRTLVGSYQAAGPATTTAMQLDDIFSRVEQWAAAFTGEADPRRQYARRARRDLSNLTHGQGFDARDATMQRLLICAFVNDRIGYLLGARMLDNWAGLDARAGEITQLLAGGTVIDIQHRHDLVRERAQRLAALFTKRECAAFLAVEASAVVNRIVTRMDPFVPAERRDAAVAGLRDAVIAATRVGRHMCCEPREWIVRASPRDVVLPESMTVLHSGLGPGPRRVLVCVAPAVVETLVERGRLRYKERHRMSVVATS